MIPHIKDWIVAYLQRDLNDGTIKIYSFLTSQRKSKFATL